MTNPALSRSTKEAAVLRFAAVIFLWCPLVVTAAETAGGIFMSVLPNSRSLQVGDTGSVFVAITNTNRDASAHHCYMTQHQSTPGQIIGQLLKPTDPLTNEIILDPDIRLFDVPRNSTRTYLYSFTPNVAFAPKELQLIVRCEYPRRSFGSDSVASPVYTGVNSILLTADEDAVPDVVVLASTHSGDGVLRVDGESRTGAFAVSSINLGASSALTVTADTGYRTFPIALSLCETNSEGVCTNPRIPSNEPVVLENSSQSTRTFSIFATAKAELPFAPASRRVYVRFKDQRGITRGTTSVAITSPEAAPAIHPSDVDIVLAKLPVLNRDKSLLGGATQDQIREDIRDLIESWPISDQQKSSLKDYALSLQLILQTDLEDIEKIERTASALSRGASCLRGFEREVADYGHVKMPRILFASTFNTLVRTEHYFVFSSKADDLLLELVNDPRTCGRNYILTDEAFALSGGLEQK